MSDPIDLPALPKRDKRKPKKLPKSFWEAFEASLYFGGYHEPDKELLVQTTCPIINLKTRSLA